jgi:hypothetical protein
MSLKCDQLDRVPKSMKRRLRSIRLHPCRNACFSWHGPIIVTELQRHLKEMGGGPRLPIVSGKIRRDVARAVSLNGTTVIHSSKTRVLLWFLATQPVV